MSAKMAGRLKQIYNHFLPQHIMRYQLLLHTCSNLLKSNMHEPVILSSSHFTTLAMPKITGWSYKFPKIVISGKKSFAKSLFVKELLGIHGLDLGQDNTKFRIFFNSYTDPEHDCIKIGFGGRTYKLKNANEKILVESKYAGNSGNNVIDLHIYSAKVKRECEAVIINHDSDSDLALCGEVMKDSSSIFVNCDILTVFNLGNFFKSVVDMHTKDAKVVYVHEKKPQDHMESYQSYLDHMLIRAQEQDKSWVHKIFDGDTKEKIFYHDSDFVLVRDIKWSYENLEDFHCLAIFKDPNLMSIRDLNNGHIDLLQRVVMKSLNSFGHYFDIHKIKLDIYFHYHPSVWQLHLHFVSGTVKEKHWKYNVQEVISNLQKDSNYYRTNSLEI